MMKHVLKYLNDVLGLDVEMKPILKSDYSKLPLYIIETFRCYDVELFHRKVVFGEIRADEGMSILLMEKQVRQLEALLKKTVVLIFENIQSYQRKRLIERGINFVVPGKQLFLPALLVDLRESFGRETVKMGMLLPSSQLLIIYQIMRGSLDWNIEGHSFKEIAQKFGYSAMAITKAVDNLKGLELIEVLGEKEKFVRFRYDKKELWDKLLNENAFVNPVLKTVFVDELPAGLKVVKCNNNGLSMYTNINPGNQLFSAMEKDEYYELQRENALVNPNSREGKYALEIWKYAPLNMRGKLDVVDPLSLYLSLRNSSDERIEIALDQLLNNCVW